MILLGSNHWAAQPVLLDVDGRPAAVEISDGPPFERSYFPAVGGKFLSNFSEAFSSFFVFFSGLSEILSWAVPRNTRFLVFASNMSTTSVPTVYSGHSSQRRAHAPPCRRSGSRSRRPTAVERVDVVLGLGGTVEEHVNIRLPASSTFVQPLAAMA